MLNLFRKKRGNYQNITLEEFNELRLLQDYRVLDVRAPKELVSGEVPGHILINFLSLDFKSKVGQLDKSKKYLVHCKSGNRSAKACAMMTDMGFEVYNFQGGMDAWNP